MLVRGSEAPLEICRSLGGSRQGGERNMHGCRLGEMRIKMIRARWLSQRSASRLLVRAWMEQNVRMAMLEAEDVTAAQ